MARNSVLRFEFLLVMMIIGFFVGVFFIVFSTAHDKAKISAYMTYAEQMQRFVASAVAMGYMDEYDESTFACLGSYENMNDCKKNEKLNALLTKIGTMPNPGATSPYNEHLGVMANSRRIGSKEYMEIRVGISSDIMTTKKICDAFGWGSDQSSYCYIHISQTTR